MKPNRKNRILVASLTFSLTLAARSAFATNLYWDTNGTGSAGSGAATGTWGTSVFWSTDSAGANVGSPVLTATTTGVDDLFFSAGTNGTGGTVTVNSTQTARLLTLEEGAITFSGGTISLAGGGGITVNTGAGNAIISSNLTVSGNNIINVGTGRTLTLNTGTFTRNAGATVNIQGAGTGSSTMTNLTSAAMVNNIIGPWASSGSGTGTTYAKFNGTSLSGLGYTGGVDGTSAAASTNVISTASPGTVNYTLSAAGTLGASANINTLRWGGAAGTLATSTSFTTKGIMNAGTGLLTFSGAVTSGASGTEMVVNTANNNIQFDGIFTGTITKTGSGTMTLGSAAAHSIGGITVNQGILITNHSADNSFTGASTVNIGGTLRFGSSNEFHDTTSSFTINSGGTFDLGGFNDTIGSIAGAGSITTSTGASILHVTTGTQAFSGVIGGAVSLRVTGATADLTLSGANTYTGGTFINQGTLRIDTGGRIGSGTAATSALQLGSGVVGTQTADSVGNLTLNTDNNAVGAITVRSNTADTTTAGNIGLLSIASGSTLTATSFAAGLATTDSNTTNTALSTGAAGTGGTLTVNGNFTMSPTGGASIVAAVTVVDLSGLTNFNVTSTGTGRLTVGSARNSKGTLTLANTANNINVGTLSVGDSGINNYNIAQLSTINLGAGTNALSAPIINIGAVKGGGLIRFAGASGSVVITGANGAGTANITIGNASNATYSIGSNTNGLLLAGHNATVSAGAVIIGQKSTNAAGGGNINCELTFDTGTFNATSIAMAGTTTDTVAGTAGTITGSFTVGGASANSGATGVVNVTNNLLLANLLDADPTATANGTLTINGGTVNVNTAGETTQGIRDNSLSSETSTTTLTLAGGTLNLNGGIIGGNASGNKIITNLNLRSGTLQNVLQINDGTSGLKKTTDDTGGGGTLILAGTNSFTGGVTIDAGTVQLGSAGALLTTAGSENAVTFGAASTGTLALTGRNTVVSALDTNASPGTTFLQNANGSAVSNATLTIGNSLNLASTYAGTIQDGSGGGTLALTKAGTNTLTLSGNNTFTGATSVAAGTLYVTGALTNSSVTVQAAGAIGGDGTFGSNLTIVAGGNLDLTGATLNPDGTSTGILSITGSTLTLGALTFEDLVGWSYMDAAPGTYELIDGDFTVDFGSTAFTNADNAYVFGNGNKGYFTSGSLNAVIVAIPEPSAALLGGLGLLSLLRRRRKC